MAKRGKMVRLSSKGQIVIPSGLRRELGLKTGEPLRVREGGPGQVIIERAADADASVDRMIEETRNKLAAWAQKTGRDLVDELHERRRRERERDRERWSR